MGYYKKITFLAVLLLMAALTACGEADQSKEAGVMPSGSGQQMVTQWDSSYPVEEVFDSSENTDVEATEIVDSENIQETEEVAGMKMNVQIGSAVFTATLEDNEAVYELVEMMKEEPVSISMSDYSGFEKVGSLGRSLTTEDEQTTTSAGDIVLYNSSQIVMFYGSNSWSYTRLGKIDDLSGFREALGNGNITAVFSLAE